MNPIFFRFLKIRQYCAQPALYPCQACNNFSLNPISPRYQHNTTFQSLDISIFKSNTCSHITSHQSFSNLYSQSTTPCHSERGKHGGHASSGQVRLPSMPPVAAGNRHAVSLFTVEAIAVFWSLTV